jgi:AraC-like DNA-binding protein
MLDELCGGLGPNKESPFQEGSRGSSLRLQLLMQHMLRLRPEVEDPLYKDEWTICAIAEAVRCAGSARGNAKIVDRAKEFLHAHSGERVGLQRIASALGVSPVYLTQEFARREGVPLCRYQMRLRLIRSLIELPNCDDITGLALDLGFSSHSHFTAVFRNAFAITPSDYRATVGTARMRERLLECLPPQARYAA